MLGQEWYLFDKQCFHDEIHVFFQWDYSFQDLTLRHAYLSIYYTSCFWNHYTALMIDTLRSVRLAKARLTILDRLFHCLMSKCDIIWTNLAKNIN